MRPRPHLPNSEAASFRHPFSGPLIPHAVRGGGRRVRGGGRCSAIPTGYLGRQGASLRVFSHRLSPAERNYDIGNRELLAVKLALEEWRHWLEGSGVPFIVWTDHKNLEYIQSATRLNSSRLVGHYFRTF